MVGRIKMKLGMEVGLGPGHSVLDDDLAPPKGAQPPISMSVVVIWLDGSRIKMPLGRDVQIQWVLNPVVIGRPNTTVVIKEPLLTHRKKCVGCILPQQWFVSRVTGQLAGRPSRWALAHISNSVYFADY